MSYLIVVAHPDDEVLGVGGTMYHLAQSGNEVNVCIMSSDADARTFRPSGEELNKNMHSSLDILGVNHVFTGHFPNIKLNTVPHLELVQFIEESIINSQADTIITHHPSDVNNDHLHTSLACQAAIRLFQRRDNVRPLKQFLFMEVLSATEWSTNSAINKFTPNTFVQIGDAGIEMKLQALAQYKDVMRAFPHPRSSEAIRGLAAFRGAQSGLRYAEALECVYRNGLS